MKLNERLFWIRLKNVKCVRNECSLPLVDYWCDECAKSKWSHVRNLTSIWSCVALRFSPKLSELFSYSLLETSTLVAASQQASSIDASSSSVAVGVLDMCRQFVDRCLNNQTRQRQHTQRLATAIIELMTHMCCGCSTGGGGVTVRAADLGVLFKWVQTALTNEVNNEPALVKLFVKFFIAITWKKNSSAALMKYICKDIVCLLGSGGSADTTVGADTSVAFACLNGEHVTLLTAIVCEEITSLFADFEWFMAFKAADVAALGQLHKQLLFVLESLRCLLATIDMQSGASQELLVRLFTKFYAFMNVFCKSVAARPVAPASDDEKCLKTIVDFTARRMQKPLEQFIRSVQNATMSTTGAKKAATSDEKKKGAKQTQQQHKSAKDTETNAKVYGSLIRLVLNCEPLMINKSRFRFELF